MSFDRDLRAKEKAKHDDRFAEMERDAIEWLRETLDRHDIPLTDLCGSLQDGTLLCSLAQKVSPSSVIRYKKSSMPFIQMENIATFLQFCAGTLEIPQHDLFQTVDLYERRNEMQVVQAIHTFSRYAVKEGHLPPTTRFLGPKMATSRAREFSKEQLAEAKNHVNTYQYGKFSGSANVVMGVRRDPAGHFH